MWNIADEELLCGCPLSWIKDLVYIICVVYCSYWGVLTQREEAQVIRVQTFAWRSAPRQLNVHQKTHENSFFRSSVHWCCPVLKPNSSFNRFLKYSVVCINRGCEWGKPTSDKGRKILLTTDRTRKKLPTTDRKNINRHYRYFFHIEEYFVNFF